MRKLILGAVFAALGGPAAAAGVPVGDCQLLNGITLTNVVESYCTFIVNGIWTASVTPTQSSDTTAPSFDVGVAVANVSSSGFTPTASINEAGTIYYVVVADGFTAPSVSQVKAGNDASGSAALAAASVAVSTSPFTSSFAAITSLSASTAYDVYFVAEDDEGLPNVQSAVTKVDATTSAAAATTSAAPTSLVATPSNGQVSVAFTAPADTGGAAITDYEYQLDGGSWVSASTDSSPVVITGLTNGTSYSIKLRAVNSAGNGTASDAVSVDMPSPTSEFAQNEAKIRQVIVDNEQRSLSNILSANRRMTSEARSRLIDARRSQDGEASGLVSRNNVPFDVDGSFELNGTTVSSRGDFFAQQGTMDGTSRRLFFGDFDIQRDGDTGSTTATLTGRVAWEQMVSDRTMLGYFIGGELAYSNIAGAFSGNQDRIGLTAGGYAVHQLAEQVYLDGFVTFGAGRNNLSMSNDVLALESDYTTRTATIGAALSGAYDYGSYELRPELAFSYGHTWIGNVNFTGRA